MAKVQSPKELDHYLARVDEDFLDAINDDPDVALKGVKKFLVK